MGKIFAEAETYLDSVAGLEGALKPFLACFDVTWAAQRVHSGSQVTAMILKPENHFSEMLGLDREVFCLYAPYPTLEPRTLQIANALMHDMPARGRVEPLVFGLISRDPKVQERTARLMSENAQSRIAVPFADTELIQAGTDPFFVRNRFQHSLYHRDLFDVAVPISSDLYFFGRSSLAVELRDALLSGDNVGLFGLRKMGKTSLILKLQRMIESEQRGRFAYFDLQDAGLYNCRWWELLERIATKLGGKPGGYDQKHAATKFRSLVESLAVEGKSWKTVVAFDEIEHIAPKIAMERHWDEDFLDLWKTLRAIQNVNRHLVIMVAGVNATVVETPLFAGHDNPLFSMIRVRYIPAFDQAEVRQMVRTLSRYMGLHFDEGCYRQLHTEYGGHPLLTRLACSIIHKNIDPAKDRPIPITPAMLEASGMQRNTELFPFGRHILGVLQKWYPEEYQMLVELARGETSFFAEMAKTVPEYATHLRAYQMVAGDPPHLAIPYLRDFLRAENPPAVPTKTLKASPKAKGEIEDLLTISDLRNRLEPRLRSFVKRVLKTHLGPERWIDPVLGAIPQENRIKLQGVDKEVILTEKVFLLNLLTVVDKEWNYFKVLEANAPERRVTKAQFRVLLDYVNAHREDAHAKAIESGELAALRLAVQAIEGAIQEFLTD